MKIYAFQLESSDWESPSDRLNRVIELLQKEYDENSLIVLPEHWIAGAFVSHNEIKSLVALYSEFVKCAQSVCDKSKLGLITGSGLNCDENGRLTNTGFFLSPETGLRKSFSKIHKFSQELGEIVGGNASVSFRYQGWHVAPLICYDVRFPEVLRQTSNFGAHLFVVVAAWPKTRIETWTHLLRVRAIENQAYVLGVNGIGKQGNLSLGGRTSLFDPYGNEILSGGRDEQILSVVLDLETIKSHRREFNYLQDAKLLKDITLEKIK